MPDPGDPFRARSATTGRSGPQRVARGLTRLLADVQVSGLDAVPRTGPVVVASNHQAFLDGPLLFGLWPRPVVFLVKSEMFTFGPMAAVLHSAGQVPVERSRVDRAPLRLALDVLDGGGVVGLFVEGTRGDGRVAQARPGAAWLALRTGATVVPVAGHGTRRMGRPAWPRPRVRVVIGAPTAVPPWPRHRPLPRMIFRAESERIRADLAELVDSTRSV